MQDFKYSVSNKNLEQKKKNENTEDVIENSLVENDFEHMI